MNAEEMFKELHYRMIDDRPVRNCIRYIKNNHQFTVQITFDLDEKMFEISLDSIYAAAINYDEYKAIKKQIEELGWN